MISFNNVTVKYDNNILPTIENMKFHMDKGEFVFLTGSSGAGKSTMMKLILKEINADDGEIIIAKTNLKKLTHSGIPYYRRKLGVVFQDYRLISTKTVYENIAFALEAVQCNPKEIKSRVANALKQVGLKNKARKYPTQLSGGEQQRVAIARAIINNPEILICDEPTGNLDSVTSQGIMHLILDINKSGTTVLIASHDSEIIKELNKRVVFISKGQIISDTLGGE